MGYLSNRFLAQAWASKFRQLVPSQCHDSAAMTSFASASFMAGADTSHWGSWIVGVKEGVRFAFPKMKAAPPMDGALMGRWWNKTELFLEDFLRALHRVGIRTWAVRCQRSDYSLGDFYVVHHENLCFFPDMAARMAEHRRSFSHWVICHASASFRIRLVSSCTAKRCPSAESRGLSTPWCFS